MRHDENWDQGYTISITFCPYVTLPCHFGLLKNYVCNSQKELDIQCLRVTFHLMRWQQYKFCTYNVILHLKGISKNKRTQALSCYCPNWLCESWVNRQSPYLNGQSFRVAIYGYNTIKWVRALTTDHSNLLRAVIDVYFCPIEKVKFQGWMTFKVCGAKYFHPIFTATLYMLCAESVQRCPSWNLKGKLSKRSRPTETVRWQ